MERIGICHHLGRVSPVFDVAESMQIFEIEDGQTRVLDERRLTSREFYSRAKEVRDCGVDTVICGAISRPLETALLGLGVKVLGLVCGPVFDVARAFAEGRLDNEAFLMPGRGRAGRNKG